MINLVSATYLQNRLQYANVNTNRIKINMSEQSDQGFPQNSQNHLNPKVELETELSDEERLKKSVTDVSSEIIGAVQEGGEAALKDYFYNILSETDGSVSPEKRLVVFEYLANQQRLANHEEALKFGETAFTELGNDSQESNSVETSFGSLGNILKQDVEDLTRAHDFGIIAKQRGDFSADSFIYSYDKLEDCTKPLEKSLSNYSEKTENWSGQKASLATDYSVESKRLGGRFEDQNKVLTEAGKTINLDGEAEPKDLSPLIDEAVVDGISESFAKTIGSSIKSGETPDVNVMQALCEIGEYYTDETMHRIDDSLAAFIQIIEDGAREIHVLKDTADDQFNRFCKQARSVRDYVRSSRDEDEAAHFSGKEKAVLAEYGYSVNKIMGNFKSMKQLTNIFSTNTRNGLRQDKKLDINASMFR